MSKAYISTIRSVEAETCEICGKKTHHYGYVADDCPLCEYCLNEPWED